MGASNDLPVKRSTISPAGSGSNSPGRTAAYALSPGRRRSRLRCAMAGLTAKPSRWTPNDGGSGSPRADHAASGPRSTVLRSSGCMRKGAWHQRGSARWRLPKGTDAGGRRTRRPAQCQCRRISRRPWWLIRGRDALSSSWTVRTGMQFCIACTMPGGLTLELVGLRASFACSRLAKRCTGGGPAADAQSR